MSIDELQEKCLEKGLTADQAWAVYSEAAKHRRGKRADETKFKAVYSARFAERFPQNAVTPETATVDIDSLINRVSGATESHGTIPVATSVDPATASLLAEVERLKAMIDGKSAVVTAKPVHDPTVFRSTKLYKLMATAGSHEKRQSRDGVPVGFRVRGIVVDHGPGSDSITLRNEGELEALLKAQDIR